MTLQHLLGDLSLLDDYGNIQRHAKGLIKALQESQIYKNQLEFEVADTAKKNNVYHMGYEQLHHHIGHKIEINDVWDWGKNRETSIEIRCLKKSCEGCEPLFEIDLIS